MPLISPLVFRSFLVATVIFSATVAHGQVWYKRKDLAVAHGWIKAPLPEHDPKGLPCYADSAWRARMLEQFPEADTDGDGVLGEQEAVLFHLRRARMFSPQGHEFEFIPPGVTHWTESVRCRDGIPLPTEVFLPEGEGPWPVVIVRSDRGRFDSGLDYANEILRMGIGVVSEDTAPTGEFLNQDLLGQAVGDRTPTREEMASIRAQQAQRDPIQDGADLIAWVRQQAWCNGKLGINGYSEASNKAKNALVGFPTGLDMVNTGIGSITRAYPDLLRTARPGKAHWDDDNVPEIPTSWKAPTGRGGEFTHWYRHQFLDAVPRIDTVYFDRTGWYDYFTRGAIVEWQALAASGKPAVLVMGVGGHGSSFPITRWFPSFGDADIMLPEASLFGLLKGDFERGDVPTRLYYFLMGDAVDPSAPGNRWMVTDRWPVEHTPVTYYLRGDDSLNKAPPNAGDASLDFTYDPRDPVRTFGGNHSPSDMHGPIDQSPLRDRADVVRAETAPLDSPVTIAGQVKADLYFESDAPDTMLTAWLVDIYPDGYAWLIQEAAMTMRFRDGFEDPKPLEAGEVARLKFTFTDTAIALAAGHRLGIWISSSSFPTYEVHPNTWDAISSYDSEARVAHQKVHVSASHPSSITLPVPVADALVPYETSKHDFRLH